MVFESKKPAGKGAQPLKQILKSIAQQVIDKNYSGLEYATANTQNSITLDRDGFAIYSAEGDFFTLEHVQFEAGDRLVVTTINGPRGVVLVLGRWQKSTLIAVRREHHTPIANETGKSTTIDAGPSQTISLARIQLSGSWLYPQSRLRIIGKFTDDQAGAGVGTLTVEDDTNGVIATLILTHGEAFELSFLWSDVSKDDFNYLEFKLTYSDSSAGTGTIDESTFLIGDS